MPDQLPPEVEEFLAAARRVVYRHRGPRQQSESPYRVMRRKCLECMSNSRKAIRFCPSRECPLFPYRGGFKPDTAREKGWDVETEEAGPA